MVIQTPLHQLLLFDLVGDQNGIYADVSTLRMGMTTSHRSTHMNSLVLF
jgi:hypothetical protein